MEFDPRRSGTRLGCSCPRPDRLLTWQAPEIPSCLLGTTPLLETVVLCWGTCPVKGVGSMAKTLLETLETLAAAAAGPAALFEARDVMKYDLVLVPSG